MLNNANNPAIRLGDSTDHGGIVITALANMDVQGKQVAADGCLVQCPKCKGVFPIVNASGVDVGGKKTAHHGDLTACGASLISSL